MKVKGKHEAVECYEPLCTDEQADDALRGRVAAYHEALAMYHKQRWDEAQSQFEALLAEEPDCLLYQVYLERIGTLRDAELPADWDGAFTHTSK